MPVNATGSSNSGYTSVKEKKQGAREAMAEHVLQTVVIDKENLNVANLVVEFTTEHPLKIEEVKEYIPYIVADLPPEVQLNGEPGDLQPNDTITFVEGREEWFATLTTKWTPG